MTGVKILFCYDANLEAVQRNNVFKELGMGVLMVRLGLVVLLLVINRVF